MVQIRQQLALELMREADVNTVQEIEREIFATPWPRNAYYRELASRASAHYVILRHEGMVEGIELPKHFRSPDLDPTIVGYGGMWRMYDEAHVTTIGVRRDLQHHGYGRILFAGLVQASYDMGAKWITLEVRTTNDNAMKMYEGFAFKVIGRRKGYYTDNGEDAIVMWSDSIHSPRFRRAFEANLERIDVDVRGLRRTS
jgi:ribosomal-protein-alanine N-acetyltransferase